MTATVSPEANAQHADVHTATLGELVVAQPAAAALFERLDLDYCCGGGRSLEEACSTRGLAASTVRAMLEGLRRDPETSPCAALDLSGASIAELCEHIVVHHHGPLRVELQRISKLLGTVARVHGRARPELVELHHLFAATSTDLEDHLQREEQTLFPACIGLDDDPRTPALDDGALALLRDDHQKVGAALSAMRELAGGYGDDGALCGTHRELLRSLHAFELDLHQHVHEENNVLFPRVLAVA